VVDDLEAEAVGQGQAILQLTLCSYDVDRCGSRSAAKTRRRAQPS
jgi:hypothetical protein